MNTIVGFIGDMVVNSFFMLLASALLFTLFFVWLNRKDSKTDERHYHETFHPEEDFAANMEREPEYEINPKKALRAYSQNKEKRGEPGEEGGS